MFVRQAVTSRRDFGLRNWACWLREDLGSRPYHWLRATMFLLLPSLYLRTRRPGPLVSLLSLFLLMLSSVRLGCLNFVGVVTLSSRFPSSLILLGRVCHRITLLTFLGSLVRISLMLPRLKSLLPLGWVVGLGTKLGLCRPFISLGWRCCGEWGSLQVFGPIFFLMPRMP